MGSTKPQPFIVQCEKCNKVLSDATALVLSDKERNIIVVKAASNIIVDEAGAGSHYSPSLFFLFFSLFGREKKKAVPNHTTSTESALPSNFPCEA